MADKKELTSKYTAGQVAESVRPVILNDAQQELSIHEVLAEIRNDVRELKEKLL